MQGPQLYKKDPCILHILTSKENWKIIQIIFISLLYFCTPFTPLRVRKIHNKINYKWRQKFNRKFILSYWLLINLQGWRYNFLSLTTLHTFAHTFGHTFSGTLLFLLLPLIYRQNIYKWQVRIKFKWLDGRKNIYKVFRGLI